MRKLIAWHAEQRFELYDLQMIPENRTICQGRIPNELMHCPKYLPIGAAKLARK